VSAPAHPPAAVRQCASASIKARTARTRREERRHVLTKAEPDGQDIGEQIADSKAETELRLFFTAYEVAQILRTTDKAVYAQVERGLLPGVTRIGRRLLFCRAELLDWLRQKSAPSPKGSRR
jgi:excisionase family DNA binding protein